MNNISGIIAQIKELEKKLLQEIQEREDLFYYQIKGKKIHFEAATKKYHKTLVTNVYKYLLSAEILNILTVPLIWSCLFPAIFMDLTVSLYQAICFPVYKIPKVRRGDYIVIDRHSLSYLNIIEKINCLYCGYFNGLIAYIQEIAGRTEQYWCPIKHARKVSYIHSRYRYFIDYGDSESYRNQLDEIRKRFEDIK